MDTSLVLELYIGFMRHRSDAFNVGMDASCGYECMIVVTAATQLSHLNPQDLTTAAPDPRGMGFPTLPRVILTCQAANQGAINPVVPA